LPQNTVISPICEFSIDILRRRAYNRHINKETEKNNAWLFCNGNDVHVHGHDVYAQPLSRKINLAVFFFCVCKAESREVFRFFL
jgi:hypothetical protein